MSLLTPSDQLLCFLSSAWQGEVTEHFSSRIMEWVRLEGILNPILFNVFQLFDPSFYCCWQALNIPSLTLLNTEFPPRGSEGSLKDKQTAVPQRKTATGPLGRPSACPGAGKGLWTVGKGL